MMLNCLNSSGNVEQRQRGIGQESPVVQAAGREGKSRVGRRKGERRREGGT